MRWTAIQLGSREHYAIPVALHASGQLDCCITDTWLSTSVAALVRPVLPSFAGRRHEELPDAKVRSNTMGRLMTDWRLRRQRKSPWSTILERNEWFGAWAAAECEHIGSSAVFSYSYTARLPFAEARRRNARCILGQIDPGPREQEFVEEQTTAYRHLAPSNDKIPDLYWQRWREEVELADKIVVNSPWSAKLLVEAGVDAAKLVEIPLVYAPEARSDEWRVTGDESKEERRKVGKADRLQALFLGSVILRKGVGQLFDAIKMIRNEPVDFVFAGPVGVRVPDEIFALDNVRFLGPVDQATAGRLYREADIFLFPTLSDGFGLTQLEALGHGIPVVASKNCGRVVEHGTNGLLLPAVTPEAIAEAVMQFLRDPQLARQLGARARVPEAFRPERLSAALALLKY